MAKISLLRRKHLALHEMSVLEATLACGLLAFIAEIVSVFRASGCLNQDVGRTNGETLLKDGQYSSHQL